MAKLLLIEDDALVGEAVIDSLELANHTVEWVQDGREGLDRLTLYSYDLAIVDWNLPFVSGIEICEQYRARAGAIPLLMLTSNFEITEKVRGFSAGADDYLTKPFLVPELIARVSALLRRPPIPLLEILCLGDLQLHLKEHRVTYAGQEIPLLPKEFSVLRFLIQNKNQVFKADKLLDHVWSSESDATEDAVKMCIMRLRKKLTAAGAENVISTIKNVGYKVEDPQ